MQMGGITQEFSVDTEAKDINELLMIILGTIIVEEDD